MRLELIDKYFLQAFSKEMEEKKDRAELVYIFNILFFKKPVFNKESLSIKFDRLKILARQKPVFSLDIHVILGLGYYLGIPVKQDTKEALEHFTLAAEREYAPAQFLLGCHWGCLGDTMLEDPTEAIKAYKLFEKAAKQEFAPAQYALGCFMEPLKDGQERNGIEDQALASEAKMRYIAADAHFMEAAQKGFAPAQYKLGMSCLRDVVKSPWAFDAAKEYLRKAADQGFTKAYEELGCLMFQSFAVSGIKLEEDQARKELRAAAKLGSSSALLWLGEMEDKSIHIRKRIFPKAALECYFQSLKLGNMHTQEKFANLNMENGNYNEAFRYAQKALAHGSKLPRGTLFFEMEEIVGFCYFYGLGMQKDFRRAFEFFQAISRIFDELRPTLNFKCLKMTHYHLGMLYKDGLGGVNCNPRQAFEYFSLSVERTTLMEEMNPIQETQNFLETEHVTLPRDALIQLGICYEKGYGVDRDVEKALENYARASEAGSVEAKDRLVRLKVVQEKQRADQQHPAAATAAASSKMRR